LTVKGQHNKVNHLKLVGQVDDLVVNGQLLSLVSEDQNPDGTRALAERLPDLVVEVALVNDLQSLLDLTILGHGDELAVVTDVDEPVLLEDRSQKGVEDNGWRRMGDNTWLLMELLGEEVNTEISVLTGLG